jgi:hypothetical protein
MTNTTFVSPNPNYEARVREVMAGQRALGFIGAMLDVAPGRCTLADTAGGYAGLTLFPAGGDVLTVEFKVNLIAPARGERLIAEGRVVQSGRTLTVCTIDVSAARGGELVPCAIMQQTLICIDAK